MKRLRVLAIVLVAACAGGGKDGPTGPVVARLSVSTASEALSIGQTVQLTPIALDNSGVAVPGAVVSYTSSNRAVATVSATGLVTGVSAGTVRITVRAGGRTATVDITVGVFNAPAIAALEPGTLDPGAEATITGSNFSLTPSFNVVRINGVLVQVLSATSTTLRVRLPSSGFVCSATASVPVTVTVAGSTATSSAILRTAKQRTLAINQVLTLLDPADSQCNELSQTGGRYLIQVSNHATAHTVITPFTLRGAQSAAQTAEAIPAVSPLRSTADADVSAFLRASSIALDLADEDREHRAHLSLHAENRRIARQLGSPAKVRGSGPSASASTGIAQMSSAMTVPTGPVGSVQSIRVPTITATNFCNTFVEIRARIVYIGTRSVVYVDSAAPDAGQTDEDYRNLGREFDNVMFPILNENFGDPLAADLDNDGKISMVFTQKVNAFDRLLGFVVSCDFFARNQAPSSNGGETFFSVVPNLDARVGNDSLLVITPANFRRRIMGVVMHEAKHIVSYASRFSQTPAGQNPPFEETWLEEGSAMLAEELWARTKYGNVWKGNANYRQTIFCDPSNRATLPECVGKPFSMLDHFTRLYRYQEQTETLTPLGPTSATESLFYGSAWWLIRWTIDAHAPSEAAFLRALTASITQTGTANLSARAGRPWPELAANWGVATALDDAPGFAPPEPKFMVASWNLTDINKNIADDFVNFDDQTPLMMRLVNFGTFSQTVTTLRGGSFSTFSLSGAQSGPQILELKSPGGGTAPNLGLSIVRLQ